MITSEGLIKANEKLKSIDVKGKGYVTVNERIKAFRELEPSGKITTDILSLEDGVVTMMAKVEDGEGNLLATGYAQEKETSSYINKTSYIENCETSAVGRALGFAGIGIDGSMASAEEVANAITQQNVLKNTISAKEQKILESMVRKRGLDLNKVLNGKKITEVTGEQYQDAITRLGKLPEVSTENIINENEALNG